MNLHEYQGKEILKSFGVAIQEGIVADTVEGAIAAAEELTKQTGTKYWVVKSQIHAGGRGKEKLPAPNSVAFRLQNRWMMCAPLQKIFWAMCWLQFKRAMQAKK